jgi:hypothetical protein
MAPDRQTKYVGRKSRTATPPSSWQVQVSRGVSSVIPTSALRSHRFIDDPEGRLVSVARSAMAAASANPLARSIRVASVPASHVYVRHLSPIYDGQGHVFRLPDPAPVGAASAAARWWPPAMLNSAWVRAHQDQFDVFHVQFGFDAIDPTKLKDIASTLKDLRKPLVYTVHDLRNPHHAERREHDAQLDVLISNADALITLTRGAAGEVERRWGRRPVVIAHPHVVPLERTSGRHQRDDGAFVVGVHAKSLRANMAPAPVISALLTLVGELAGFRLQVNVHRDVFEPTGARHDAALAAFLQGAADRGLLALVVHDFYSDEQLWKYLASLDVSVLPYRFGTHSGWLEACYDLGTTVVAPTCGFYAEQRPCLSYGHDEAHLDEKSLLDAVRFVYRERPAWQARRTDRETERDAIAREHFSLYTSVLR